MHKDAEKTCTYSTKYLAECVRQVRKKNNNVLTTFNTLADQIGYTEKGVKFLLYDSGCDDNFRVIVFGSESNIIHLGNNGTWIIDGTFKITPIGFEQVLIIQAIIKN